MPNTDLFANYKQKPVNAERRAELRKKVVVHFDEITGDIIAENWSGGVVTGHKRYRAVDFSRFGEFGFLTVGHITP